MSPPFFVLKFEYILTLMWVDKMSLKLDRTSVSKIEEVATEVCQREGCILYDIEFIGGSKGKGRTLRVFIDKEGEAVGVDDCAKISRSLSFYLDTDEDLVPGDHYSLEVSSPGLERPLTRPWHFLKSVGENVAFKIERSLSEFGGKIQNQKRFSGKIVSADSTNIKVLVADYEVELPIEIILKATVIYDYQSAIKEKNHKEIRE
jgi:ribosome maturation factor RimP